MDIKIVDEELGLVKVTETVKDDARDEVIQKQSKYTTIDGIIITLLDSCISELDNEWGLHILFFFRSIYKCYNEKENF